MSKIDIQNPKKYFGKEKGDTTLARVAHVNHALEVAEQNGGEHYQLQMPYMYYPEFAMVKTGNKVTYNGGPTWETYKVSGSVYPTQTPNGVFTWYLCSVRTKLGDVWGPFGAIPYALTGTISNANGNGTVTTVSSLAPGALAYDNNEDQNIALTQCRVELNNEQMEEDGSIVQHLFLVTEADSTDYSFSGFVQFEFIVPEGSTVEFFLD